MDTWRVLLFSCVAGCFSLPVLADEDHDNHEGHEHGIPWAESFEKALEQARTAKKPIMVDFEAEWCSWCKKLDRETFGDERVIRFVRENFVAVKVDTDESPDLAKKYKVGALPTILFLSPEGEELERLHGFRDPQVFLKDAQKPAQSAAKLSDLKQAAEKDPNDLAAQRAYARALFATGNLDGALAVLKEARKKAPEDVGILLDLADTLNASRKLDEAQAVYEMILEIPEEKAKEERAKVYLPLARILISSDKHAKAIPVLGEYLKRDLEVEQRFHALFLRSFAHAVQKDPASAIKDLRAAQELDRDSPWSLRAEYIIELVESE